MTKGSTSYGPYLPTSGRNGKRYRTYLLAILDDATRFVIHAEFYDQQKLPILEDALKKGIGRNGSPRSIYVDNGKIFVSTWMKLACAHLNIRHLNTRPYSPEAKGKIERFNRTVEEFLAEASLQRVSTLEELNAFFRGWLSERYQHKPHSSLGGKTPAEAFAKDPAPLRFHGLETLQDAFLHEAERMVDKSGCLQLGGQVYDAGADFVRRKVLLRYDPFDTSRIQLWHQGQKIRDIAPIRLGETNDTLAAPPEAVEKSGESRVLQSLAKSCQERCRKRLGAFRLGTATSDGTNDAEKEAAKGRKADD